MDITFSLHSKLSKFLWNIVRKYNHEKYWKRRAIVIDSNNKTPLIIKLYYLYYIKKTDAYHNSSFGTSLGSGAKFLSPPTLLHGPNGIIIGHDAEIGSNCIIMHQVTIEQGNVKVGNNVFIGAGAKILKNTIIGNNCLIGANAVVVEDMPDNSTCVLAKPRIIIKNIEDK